MSDLTNAIVQGMNARRAAREEGYLNQRRAITDPREDAAAAQKAEGMNSLVAQYGPQAAVANERGQVIGEDDRHVAAGDTHTANVEQAGDNAHARAAAATIAFINGLDAADAQDKTGQAAHQFAKDNQAMFKDMGLTDDTLVMQHVPQMLNDPAKRNAERQVAQTILAKGQPKEPKLLTGEDDKGNPAYLDQNTEGGVTSLTPVKGGHPNNKLYEFAPQREKTPEELDAIVALGEQRRAAAGLSTAKAGAAGGGKSNSTVQATNDSIDDYINAVAKLKAGGGSVEPDANPVSNGLNAAATTGAGKMAARVLGDKNAGTRSDIDAIAPLVLSNIQALTGKKSSQLNTEKEYARFAAVLGDTTASAATRIAAAKRLKAWVATQTAATPAAAPAGEAAPAAAPKVIKYDATGNRVQ